MADRRAAVRRLLARGDPVPGRPGGEQRPGLVPAAQGRVRAAAQGAAGGDDRGARRAPRGARRPDPRRPEALAVPDLPRHAVQQGQVAVQGPPRARASRGSRRTRPAKRRRPRRAGPRQRRLLPLPARRDVRRWRDVADGEAPARGVPDASVRDDPDRVRAALEDPAFVAWFGDAHGARRAEAVPARLPAGPPDGPACSCWKDVVFGRRLSDDEVLSPDLPDRLAEGYATAMPVFRFLSTLA